MRKLLIGLSFLAAFGLGKASAYTSNFTAVNPGGASTGITCTPVSPWTISGTAPNFTLNYPSTSPQPIPANSGVCTLAVAPAGWSGSLTPSGTNASLFSLVGTTLNVGAAAISAGTYTFSITATP